MPLSDDMIRAVAESQAQIDAQNAEFTGRYHALRRSEGAVRVPCTVLRDGQEVYSTYTFAVPATLYVQGGPELGGSTTRGYRVEMPALREGDVLMVTWPGEAGSWTG